MRDGAQRRERAKSIRGALQGREAGGDRSLARLPLQWSRGD